MNTNNYGLNGQTDSDYFYFLCGKKCKKRKKEKRDIRFERRRLKNDERRADTERTRVETMIMKNTMMNPTTPPPQQQSPSQSYANVQKNPAPQQAGMGGNTMMIVLGALVIGGIVLSQMKGRPPVVAGQVPIASAPILKQ
ncbi:hypothetical protein GCM10009122_23160 [Fulvivirga kasyanovii]|uniref:LPXTG cell wall anchor domain-containing protein n=1 Tax=Fulvivirga kasyanovii TaxID=396812 RepID=A0ABW9RYC1_9BACT|nr:hypothetical protein [Fulvivirga kasyanovii]MTI28978.1 hypothetical protein [Fulvivirga kasyanovii]